MKKCNHNKIEDMIIKASDPNEVNLDIDLNTEINQTIIAKLVPPKQSKKKKRNRLLKIFTPIAASLVVFIIALSTIPFLFTSHTDFTFQDKDLYEKSITKDQLIKEVKDVKLPSYPLDVVNINLFRTKAVDELIYAEINYSHLNSAKLKLTIVLVDNYKIKDIAKYSALDEKEYILEYLVNYSILDKSAFAKMKISNYVYFLEYESNSPKDLIEIIKSM